MCEVCESEPGDRGPGIDLSLLPAARAIEADTPGMRASAEAWDIFAGRAGGGVSWADYQRILAAYEAAEAAAARPRLGGRRRGSAFRCEQGSVRS